MRITSRTAPALAKGPGLQPLPRSVPVRTRRVVEYAVSAAWRQVVRAFDVQALTEAEISTEMVNVLNRMLDDPAEPVRGFTSSIFETVQRGGETQNYSGVHIEKRPDITVRLQGLRRPAAADRAHYGVFIECKILDVRHSVRDYCDKGVWRFVNGDYAWAMNHAMMVAYVRSDVPSTKLQEQLSDSAYACESCEGFVTGSPQDGDWLTETRHGRTWVYPALGTSPGAIVIVHLWLSTAP